MSEIYTDHLDDPVDAQILDCLNLENPRSFFLFAGAGSGKTRSLVEVLSRIRDKYGNYLRLHKKNIAIITYTNAASDEIRQRLQNDTSFVVSTIHSFLWELIKYYQYDIKQWVYQNLSIEVQKLEAEQAKGRPGTKAALDRGFKIKRKKERLASFEKITKFVYNPNGDNETKDSLSHSQLIKMAKDFLNKPLLQEILVQQFPILLIDESQDTNKELIEVFFEIQKSYKHQFSLGLFGDLMQRIYADGKSDLGQDLPDDWCLLDKRMNHRCPKRIITLINKIREPFDGKIQLPRVEKEDGLVRLFIADPNSNRVAIEKKILLTMAEKTDDPLWNSENIKVLALEHRMVAQRLNFSQFFDPLYKVEKLKQRLLRGNMSETAFCTDIILPLVEADKWGDAFGVAKIVRDHSPLFRRETFKLAEDPAVIVNQAKISVGSLCDLWVGGADPSLGAVLENINESGLFNLPEKFKIVLNRKKYAGEIVVTEDNDQQNVIDAWEKVMDCSFSQLKAYNDYVTDKSEFGTHQGVKGLEFDRVLAIIDDSHSGGFMFSFDKLFGAKEPSQTDMDNRTQGKETVIDRTRRLFYVICSRAVKSLAIVIYVNNPQVVKNEIIREKWFYENEIEVL